MGANCALEGTSGISIRRRDENGDEVACAAELSVVTSRPYDVLGAVLVLFPIH